MQEIDYWEVDVVNWNENEHPRDSESLLISMAEHQQSKKDCKK